MTARDSLAMRVTASLFRAYRSAVVWFWAILFLIYVGVGIFEAALRPTILGTGLDLWGGIAPQASRVFVLVLGILVVTLSLPVYVAHGLTRRDFAAGGALFGLLLGLLCALAVQAGYLIQPWVYAAGTRPEQPVLGSAANQMLFAITWFLTGSLVGAAFYRFRKWGMLSIPVGLALLAAVEAASTGSFVASLPWEGGLAATISIALRLGIVALSAAANYLVVRDLALRGRQP